MSDNNQTKPSITIHQAQQIVDEWINTTGVRYFNELTNMAILTLHGAMANKVRKNLTAIRT